MNAIYCYIFFLLGLNIVTITKKEAEELVQANQCITMIILHLNNSNKNYNIYVFFLEKLENLLW